MSLIKIIRNILVFVFILILASCVLVTDVNKPVNLLWSKTGKKTDSLIIFFPGLYDTADKFKDEKFFLIARKAGIKADMVSANINVFHLVNNMMIKRIETDVLQHAKEVGYKNIWLVGVSLGGLNSLLFYTKHERNICGVVTLSPFVANTPLIDDLKNAKEIKYWQPGSVDNKLTLEKKLRFLWVWLKQQSLNNNLKQIYLGYGKQDRFAEAIKLFENILDKNNIVYVEGEHNWETGQKIWQKQLLSRFKTGLLQPCN